MLEAADETPDLLQINAGRDFNDKIAPMMLRSELLSARVPRYTSYPTAPHFGADVAATQFQRWLTDLPRQEAISLYVHIPFCDSLCWFCGCHTRVVNSYAPIAAYVDVLLSELDLVVRTLGERRPVTHIHFGGGSPTILNPTDIGRLSETIRNRFDVRPDAEFAVEIDPRNLAQDTVDAFFRAGVTRASLGVQDVNPRVQRAVNRWQPIVVTREAVARLRAAGITALNIDLMYGLPHQTVDDVRRTIDAAVALNPQRFAVFGYAHVPEMKRHQHLIDATALPGAEERLRQYDEAHASLAKHGYVPIGIDHFALPDDPLVLAQSRGKLARNFQGYTTDAANALIGLGASAISALPQGYAQNATAVPDYRKKILRGELATARGRALTDDDRLRRAIIERLMCDLEVDLDVVAARHGRNSSELINELRSLASLHAEGLVTIEGNRLTIPNDRRAGVRLVCAAFDAFLQARPVRHAAAV